MVRCVERLNEAVDEVKGLRDKSEALRAYARQSKNRQLEVDASEIRIRAERRIGELMDAQRKTGELHLGGRPKTGSEADPVLNRASLEAAGVNKHLADRARKYAAIPEDFEAKLAERRETIKREDARVTVDLLTAGDRAQAGKWEGAMALDPRLVDERLLQEATERATKKLGAPVESAQIQGSIIRVRSARKQMTFRICQAHACDERGISYAGGTSWWLEEQTSFWRRLLAFVGL